MAKLAATTFHGLNRMLSGSTTTRKIGNNTVATRCWESDNIAITLHGHRIVELAPNGDVMFTLAGYPTVTTRERVNQFLPAGFRLYQSDWTQYLSTRTGEILPLTSSEWVTCDDVSGAASFGALA